MITQHSSMRSFVCSFSVSHLKIVQLSDCIKIYRGPRVVIWLTQPDGGILADTAHRPKIARIPRILPPTSQSICFTVCSACQTDRKRARELPAAFGDRGNGHPWLASHVTLVKSGAVFHRPVHHAPIAHWTMFHARPVWAGDLGEPGVEKKANQSDCMEG